MKTVGKKEHAIKGQLVRNFWPPNYKRVVNGVETTFRGDPEYTNVAIGDTFCGGTFQCQTTPYNINGGPQITTWKGVVFEGEDPYRVAARALRQNNAVPLVYNEETDEMEKFILQPVANTTGNNTSANAGTGAGAQPEVKETVGADANDPK
jgi:hypothetical protein